jgi:lipoprotein-anchoring transpeptidase ErfK/SrfK
MKRLILLAALQSCAPHPAPEIVISVSEQSMRLGAITYSVGTSSHGTGNAPGSHKTPLGEMAVVQKWDADAADYHGRVRGKKLWLAGADCPAERRIYIHAGRTGRPSSIGCVHLSDADLAEVFEAVDVGAAVRIVP